ncbi:glycosyltransferase [uncultured Vibrio sp.]|uniref:glycosyltransferase n=1 Tax=uncultured Vibrio sp. TaxID=114054 RepID=UPI0026378362|nr:glycosyltransferase [uncultured Vibrio sp.]
MKILLLTIGTRGDVEPFIALGKALIQKGHQVDLCAPSCFQALVEENGLTYKYITDELFKLLDNGTLESMGSFVSGIKTTMKLMKKAKPLNRQMIIDSIRAGLDSEPELIVYHPKCLAAVSIGEKLNIPVVMGVLQPMIVKTGAFPPAGIPDLGSFVNRLSYRLISLAFSLYSKELNHQRTELLGLPASKRNTGILSYSNGEQVPVLHAFSKQLVSRPNDWTRDAIITGYWRTKTDLDDYKPSAELVDFLSHESKPIYIGFGSMIGKEPDKAGTMVVDAVTKAGVRAIIASGWGGLKVDELPENVLVIKSIPHAWLFPRVAAVVHHGGAGTTAAGLAAGKPTLICPFFGDQPFWGAQIKQNGLGPSPIKQKKLTSDNLSKALIELVSNQNFKINASNLAEVLSHENGVNTAIAWMEKKDLLK